jgi:BirA family biotin operon repressor/biotin-[acetyl-CoA-carboxylase] ligase
MLNITLLPLLADGEFRSGQYLADALGVSRTAVWKQLNKLDELGLGIESVKGRGYRIPGGIELLSEPLIRAQLTEQADSQLSQLVIDEVVGSTNAEVLRRLEEGVGAGLVCTAERQSSGRGRRGRTWVSPFARNIYVSVAAQFSQGAASLEGLSLAVGVAVARALQACDIHGLQLKWPNDVLHQGSKLGGVLLEMVGDAAGSCQVVVGVGLNVAMPASTATHIDQDWTDVAQITNALKIPCPSRNTILAALLNELLPLLNSFEGQGFAAWQEPWQALDAHAGKSVVLSSGDKQRAGIARGVNERGALQLETTLGVESVFGGEISMRVSE